MEYKQWAFSVYRGQLSEDGPLHMLEVKVYKNTFTLLISLPDISWA